MSLRDYRKDVSEGKVQLNTTRLSPKEKSLANPKSLRNRINWMCYECMGNSKSLVKGCTCISCPLYPVRPWTKHG